MTRQQAARTNGARSQGPTTEQGKARSSQNAIKHGLNAKAIVLAHESQEFFDSLLDDLQARWCPVGDLERDLLLSMAAARWRLQRIAAMEKAVFDQEAQRVLNDTENPVDPDMAIEIAYANVAAGSALHRLHKYECRLRRDYVEAERQLRAAQDARFNSGYKRAEQNEPETESDTSEIEEFVELLRANNPDMTDREIAIQVLDLTRARLIEQSRDADAPAPAEMAA